MRILLITDAWFPQVNGVVRTLDTVFGELRGLGHETEVVSPDRFRTVPCPTYPEIRLAFGARKGIEAALDRFEPDAVHIATEGPLGMAGRKACLRRGLKFTTSYHTRFPDYIHARFRIPRSWSYAVLRRFHNAAAGVMVATPTLVRELEGRGFERVLRWSRGVDTERFRPRETDVLAGPRPIFLYVGRVAVEKSVEDFLALDLPGTKYVVGDGPMRRELERRFPEARFTGAKHGEELAAHYAAADVFVFPSRTDTFGLVLLEALASGTPVAAYPVPGPIDVIPEGAGIGVLDEDLAKAARAALALSPVRCRAHALGQSWRACAELFLANLCPNRLASGPVPASKETPLIA